MLYAIQQVNNNTNLLKGIKLGYDIRDFCQDPVRAAKHAWEFAIASKMADCGNVSCSSDGQCQCQKTSNKNNSYTMTKPVAAIVGALTSRAAIPLANFLQAVRIPLIDSAATSEELSSPLYDSFFRTIPSDVNQAKAIADIIDHFQWRYVAAAVVDDSYGRHGAKALERESHKRGTFYIDLIGYIPISNYDSKLKSIVTVLKQRKTVRVIVLWSHSFQGKKLLATAAEEGLWNRIWIFSEALTMAKPEYLRVQKGLGSTGTHFGVQLPKISSNGYMKYLRNKVTNKSRELNHWWREFWPLVHKENNCSVDCSEVAFSMVQDDFVPYIIDAIYTAAHAIDKYTRCLRPDGSNITGSCTRGPKNLRPAEMIGYLKKVSFDGVTGKVEFDERGDPKEASYDIVYFNITNSSTGEQRLSKETVGHWNKKLKNRLVFKEDVYISWKTSDGRSPISRCTEECVPGQFKALTTAFCWKCLQCPTGSITTIYGAFNCSTCSKTQMSSSDNTVCEDLPIGNLKWTDMSGVILAGVSVFGLVSDIIAVLVFIQYRDTPMVKASNKVYSFVLLIGIALCFGIALLHIAEPSKAICYALKPLRYIIYTLCCSALFLKTMQIVHAFNVSRLKDWIWIVICSTKRQVLVLVLVLAVEVFLGLAWILIDPPYLNVTIIAKSHVFLTCEPFSKITGQVLELMLLAYLISMAGLCTYYAFRARNLPANFNEAKYICFSLYIFLLSWITYYPVDYALEGWYAAILSTATILLSSYGLLGCIFVPKLYIIIRHPEKNTAEFVRAELRQSTINRSMNNDISNGSRGSPV
ncbi:Metabotropic glutamate receptor 8 [Exaiptasia diaphana]|nr:Metabotropic glutamate receptor 8 [Exaiptasia diaphana]